MSNLPKQINKDDKVVSRGELVELVLEPLSSLIENARVEILKKIRDVDDLLDMVARQMNREIEQKPTAKKKDVSS